MKKIFFFIIPFILVSCSSKKSELEIDIDNLKKEGIVFIEKTFQLMNKTV